MSEDAKDLINHLLVVDPAKRYTCEDVLKVCTPSTRQRGPGSGGLPLSSVFDLIPSLLPPKNAYLLL